MRITVVDLKRCHPKGRQSKKEAHMRENQKTDTRLVKQLSETVLDNVSGGFTKVVDNSSPILFKLCYTGTHIPTAK